MGSFLFEDISMVDHRGAAFAHRWVGVSEGCIDYIGDHAPSGSYDERYDGSGKLLMPGLYNAHAHVPMTLLRGRGENLPLDRWLNEAIFPFEDLIEDPDAYYASLLGIAEMLRFGVVSFSDMYYHSDARARAIIESGIKCNLGDSVICFDPDASYADLPHASLNERLVREYHGAADGRLLVDYNLHAEYTSTERVVRTLAEATLDQGLRMQVHVSETSSEVAACTVSYTHLTLPTN